MSAAGAAAVCPTVSSDALVTVAAPNSAGGLVVEFEDTFMNRVGLGLHEIEIDITAALAAIPFDVTRVSIEIADENEVAAVKDADMPATLSPRDDTTIAAQIFTESITTDAVTQDHTKFSAWHNFEARGEYRASVKFHFDEGFMTSINAIRIGAGDGQSLYFGG